MCIRNGGSAVQNNGSAKINGVTLKADRVIGLNGSKLTANTSDSKNGVKTGKLLADQANILLSEGCAKNASDFAILPIWIEDHYEFSLFNIQVTTSAQGLRIDEANEYIEFKFAHQESGDYKSTLSDGGLKEGVKVVQEPSWITENKTGTPFQNFVYNGAFSGIAAGGSNNYTFNLKGYGALYMDLSTMKLVAKVVTDTGATLASAEYTTANDKMK